MRAIVFLLLIFPSYIFSQSQENESIEHNGIERNFTISIPSYYDGSEPMPVVFNFHGFGSNNVEQAFYGEFRPIAESEGFLVVHPQGTEINDQAHWNVGGFTLGSTTDDVDFTSTMIDFLIENYNIDQERIYATGMSNGGFMSYLLACELGDRIAAIASVTGSMTFGMFDNCNPAHPTPVMEIHGTEDEVVPYAGAIFAKAIPEVMEFWTNYNNCNSTPIENEIEDSAAPDASTATHFVYNDCDNDITTELFRINGGEHTWPGAIIGGAGTNRDINASQEIWNFFKRFTLSNGALSSLNNEPITRPTNIFPNPSFGSIQVKSPSSQSYQILSPLGAIIKTGDLSKGTQELELTNLTPGTYFFKTNSHIQKLFIIK